MTVMPIDRQSLLDVALQHTGIPENAYDIAVRNGKSVTDAAEGAIDVPALETDVITVDYLSNYGIVPATEIYVEPEPVPEPNPELYVIGPLDIRQTGDYEFICGVNPDYPYAYEIRWILESDDLRVDDMGSYFAAYDANDVLSVELFEGSLYVYNLGNWELKLRVQCVVGGNVADEVQYMLNVYV